MALFILLFLFLFIHRSGQNHHLMTFTLDVDFRSNRQIANVDNPNYRFGTT